ncbi:MAG: UDP-glucose/GDP-mannose dehydrogenase [Berkelbacteria bacterium GW2011_GWA1_36_9]|uniref:UDP-glucose/GDP-mannose dehydrogenase n=1 Tax=Berkelbacteria bacterium GW2011_GWA1_36_9 TaxID=1618331 RepID=A0A0G0HYZ8_9BACT|nr:MAG: UDP-glucose/GDP-mannose dehydrogenase [Berkelbacteria bacterium GW2011_GWA1_36_9]
MKISKDTTIAVCGLGYVGLPVALLFAKAGFRVFGVNRGQEKVDKINLGKNTIEGKEPGLKELVKAVHLQGNFEATTDSKVYHQADIILVAVETPVEDITHEPAYVALKSALKDIGQNMKRGTLVIIESTIAPGTMEKVVKPILEQESGLVVNKGFFLANCPERLMPGYLLSNIQNYNRVLGGMNKKATEIAKKLYKNIISGEIEETDCITAEIVKSGENTYRDVQIAFANEMALLCEAMGANVWEVRRLINNCKKIGETRPEALRQMHSPGAGVGGHCIPKDSWLLIYGAKDLLEPKLIPLSRHINDFMPRHTFHLLKNAFHETGKNLEKAKIAVLGFAYAGNSDDTRNTPTEPLLKLLEATGAEIVVHDPFVKEYKNPLEEALKGAQALVLMADHDQYKKIDIKKIKKLMKSKPIIIDGRNVFDKAKAQKLGFIYKGIGNI